MLKELFERIRQGSQTTLFPKAEPGLPPRFRGAPALDQSRCPSDCSMCVDACPTDAITLSGKLRIDLGRCIFCPACVETCQPGAISFTNGHRLAGSSRDDLVVDENGLAPVKPLPEDLLGIFRRSLKIRQVSAGGCNGCEAEISALSNVVFDMGRFGVQVVASPRHADGLMVTGPVTKNMRLALEKTITATPEPKIVIAVGACAISGGIYRERAEQLGGADAVAPVVLYIPGCPPHPVTILDGILRLLDRLD